MLIGGHRPQALGQWRRQPRHHGHPFCLVPGVVGPVCHRLALHCATDRYRYKPGKVNPSTLKLGKANTLSFRERLQYIAADRKMTPWLRGYGLGGGTVDDVLNNDHIPKVDLLVPLARAENASLEWLLRGRGAPFLVTRACNEAEAQQYLTSLGDESGWRGVCYTDGHAHVLVLTQPAEQSVKQKMKPYTALEVVSGAISRLALAQFDEVAPNARTVNIDSAGLHRLATGQTAGTWWLTRAPDLPFQVIEANTQPPGVAEAGADYHGLTAEEVSLLRTWRDIPDADRQQAMAVLAAFRRKEA